MGRVTVPEPRAGIELASAYAELTRLLWESPGVTRFLSNVALLAAAVTHPISSCGIMLHSEGNVSAAAASSELAKWADDFQLRQGQGPGLHASSANVIVHMPDLAADDRWSGYRSAAGGRVASSLSLPLAFDAEAIGALNLYTVTVHQFTDREILTGAAFAKQAAIALAILVRQQRAADFEAQLRVDTVIEQAIGIIMGRRRCPADEALTMLRETSQHRNVKLSQVAADLVSTTAGHPSARPGQPSDSSAKRAANG